ncbi:uncharacterized protein DS421_15g518820 [Arachis hypogaea]|nr:uncharacterized protein DS421_15g518820 [Arachis hypogaea]
MAGIYQISIKGRTIRFKQEEHKGFRMDCLNLVGKFITEKEINFRTCKNALVGMWENPEGVFISEVSKNKILISFKNQRKGLQILKNGSWSFRGQLLNLKVWTQNMAIEEVEHNFIEFWVQIHGLPLEFINKETAKKIGDMMGNVKKVEDPMKDNILVKNFLRVRVALNVTEALPTGFWLERDNLPNCWIFFKYERLQDSYCLNCGILGHGRKECSGETNMAPFFNFLVLIFLFFGFYALCFVYVCIFIT